MLLSEAKAEDKEVTKKLDRLLDSLKRNALKEDVRPSEGVWYWVWLKPSWVLREFRFTEYGGDIQHDVAWRNYIAPEIAKHYKVSLNEVVGVDSLINAYTGMPRGRVAKTSSKWVFYHGNDTPVNFAKAKLMIAARFNLRNALVDGTATFMYDEHEAMQDEDKAVIEAVIGEVPYANK